MSNPTWLSIQIHRLSEEQRNQVSEFIDSIQSTKPSVLIDPFGMFQGFDTSEEELAQIRQELWSNLPREDF